eukprot:m.95889 g.95889  ORF g.95889 m.95889 type:complete len:249 (+) comp18455_c0_seq1:166-912(+)
MELEISTGNTTRCNHVAQGMCATSKVMAALRCTLDGWKKYKSEEQKDAPAIKHPKLMEAVDAEEAAKSKIVLKLFLFDGTKRDKLQQTVRNALADLGVRRASVVLISAPLPNKEVLPEKYGELWKELEEMKKAGLTDHIGACDLSPKQLHQLQLIAEIEVHENQVNYKALEVAETQGLSEFVAGKNISITTHQDDCETLCNGQFGELAAAFVPGRWAASHLLRYSVVNNERSVITNMGYVFSLSKEPE